MLNETAIPPSVPPHLWVEIVKIASSKTKLECDGLTRMIAYVLQVNGITHECCTGSLWHRELRQHIALHFWIVIDGGVLDFRARTWLADSDAVPHGFFRAEDFAVDYVGEAFNAVMTEALFSILLAVG